MEHELAKHALSHEHKKSKMKALKEMHVKELHDGSYHMKKMSGKPGEEPEEGSAKDLDEVHDAMEEHMGEKNQGEGEEEPNPEPGV